MPLSNAINMGASLEEIAALLDNCSVEERLQAIRSVGKKAQRTLFNLCAETPKLDLSYFATSEVGIEVIHEGKNSLPAFTLFQKRFIRLDENTVVGYNHGSTMHLIGPGYFILKETADQPEWSQYGSVVVDYYEVPSNTMTLPPHWPKVKHNHQGLQIVVYNKMHDFMRRVSTHVSIGSAFKKGKSIDSYFLLCRQ